MRILKLLLILSPLIIAALAIQDMESRHAQRFHAAHYAQAEEAIGGKPNARIVIGDATYTTDGKGWLYMQGQDDLAPIPIDFRFTFGDD